MSMWRCPHCGTPQAETARCWVCHRSSTTCSTCQHFRRSVAAQVGYCGLDRRRLPLIGTEHRGCWEGGAPKQAETRSVARHWSEPRPDEEPPRDFVPVELARERISQSVSVGSKHSLPTARAEHKVTATTSSEVPLVDPWAARVTLFNDLET